MIILAGDPLHAYITNMITHGKFDKSVGSIGTSPAPPSSANPQPPQGLNTERLLIIYTFSSWIDL